ncbi:related to TMT1 - trans-aconitate methyltransferase [Melanopsichium pennsylvanicum]|uniref:Related to TMT1 - trans-aconitate methyltransferase n=2 Tax=Melanopsichium pennsylvanicum TaxID=63383 RepID=A0AAJ5C3F9_9BASI|nr:s-adenosyl-l-methionine-dependent methyltransferase [Melanopsichium pennsylvanicum 4]SNX82591.1 related to TMT1 - trans-aconitate methyltransferase [Melanopsichium pennsylvanicum]
METQQHELLDNQSLSHKLLLAHTNDSTRSKSGNRGNSLSCTFRRLKQHFSSRTKQEPPLPTSPICGSTNTNTSSSIKASKQRFASAKSWFSYPTPSTSFLSLTSTLLSSSSASSLSSSAYSLVFPLDPEFEAELDIALEMAPHELGSAWSHDSYNAMQYLRARTSYPPTMTQTAFDYHAQGDKDSSNGERWNSALEIGCGPGQMSIHMATRFGKVFGQDPSPNMLKLANTVKLMSAQDLADVKLPPVNNPDRIEFMQARGEDPVLPRGEKVDLIMMAACIHWMDWETPESTIYNWRKWASLLKPGGTLIVTGGRPVIGPYTSEKGDQIRPLRDWFLDFPSQYPEIDSYYGAHGAVQALRTGGLYRKLAMPWDHDAALAELWDKHSYCWIPIDDCTVLGEAATSSRLSKVDDPEEFAATLSKLPHWIRPGVRRAAQCNNSHGDLVVSSTTPRKLVDWVRSTSAYLKYLQNNPEQKKLSLQDQDFAAVEVAKVCESIGIAFDSDIELHHSGAVLGIRRTGKQC